MSDREIVRRPRLEPHNSRAADPSADWRRFVLEQVGYDEIGREQSARRADRLRALRRFIGGIIFGLIVFALALASLLAGQAFQAGRFDRYLPKASEAPAPPPPSARWARDARSQPLESRDTHEELQDPFAPPPRASAPDTDDGSNGDGN
ncbi:hypothetical protein [Sphingomonas oryzagri]